MAQTPKKPSPPTSSNPRPLTKRALSRHERERRRQRLAITIVGSIVGFSVLVLLIGLIYDQLWLPSRPVATVGNVTLSRRDYSTERRNEIARNIAQTLQLQRLLGSYASQMQGQVSTLERLIPLIKNADVDETTVSNWVDREVIVQGAAKEGITATDGEVAQLMVNDLIKVFPAASSSMTDTTTLTPTASTITDDELATVIAEPTAEFTPTVAATSEATPTVGPTETPFPTETPAPTFAPDAALTEQDAVIARLYNAYVLEIRQTDSTMTPVLSQEDFKKALHDQYLRQVVTNQVQAKLIPEDTFQVDSTPTKYVVSQILIKSTLPISATQAELDAEKARLKPQIDAIYQELQGGADFKTLVASSSQDGLTKNSGGVLPEFDPTGKTDSSTQIDSVVVDAAKALSVGAYSEPVWTSFGWHILRLDDAIVPSKDDQISEARTKAFDTWVAEQRTSLGVERFPPQTPTATTEPTAEGAPTTPLPTAILGGEPTATPTPEVTAVPEGPTQPTATPTSVPVTATAAPTAAATSTP